MVRLLTEWVLQKGNHSNATFFRELLELGGMTREGIRDSILLRIAQILVSQMPVADQAVPVAEATMDGGAQAASAVAQPAAVGAAVGKGTRSSGSDEDDELHPGSEFTLRF